MAGKHRERKPPPGIEPLGYVPLSPRPAWVRRLDPLAKALGKVELGPGAVGPGPEDLSLMMGRVQLALLLLWVLVMLVVGAVLGVSWLIERF